MVEQLSSLKKHSKKEHVEMNSLNVSLLKRIEALERRMESSSLDENEESEESDSSPDQILKESDESEDVKISSSKENSLKTSNLSKSEDGKIIKGKEFLTPRSKEESLEDAKQMSITRRKSDEF